MGECVNCGHRDTDHNEQSTGETICIGDGYFANGEPQCDCDLFEEEEEEEVD